MYLPPVERKQIIFSPKTLKEISAALFRSSYFKGSNQEINENHIRMTVASTLKSFGEIIDIELITEETEVEIDGLVVEMRPNSLKALAASNIKASETARLLASVKGQEDLENSSPNHGDLSYGIPKGS